MTLNKESIDDLIIIYNKTFGIKLSEQEALSIGNKILMLVKYSITK